MDGGSSGLGYVRNVVDRSGVEADPDGLLARGGEPGALAVVIAGDRVVLGGEGGAATGLLPGPPSRFGSPTESVILGTRNGRPVVAAQFGQDLAEGLAERGPGEPGLRVVDLRTIAVEGLVPEGELGTLAQAKSLLSWHSRHRFCANCGAATRPATGGLRRDCPACGTQHFPRTDPVAIMLVTRGDRCLLGRQTRFVAGSYSCLAGFVSPGETIEDAVRREVMEEAGIRVGEVAYVASQPWPFPSSLMIGCFGEALSEAVTIDRTELEDARWFARDELVAMLARTHPDGLITPPPMAIAHHLMRTWIARTA